MMMWTTGLVDRLIFALLVPGIKASLHMSDTYASMLYGVAFALFYSFAGLFAGAFVDRVNRRNVLVVCCVGWSLATMACGAASSFVAIFAARFMVGVFQSAMAPASYSMVADFAPPDARGRVGGLLVGGAALGASLSSILGGVLLDAFAHQPPIHLPLLGALAPWQATVLILGAPGVPIGLALLTVREPARTGVSDGPKTNVLSFLRENWRTFAPLYAALTCGLMVAYGLTGWYFAYFVRELHMSPKNAGLIAGGVNIFNALVASGLGGWFSDAMARRDPQTGRFRAIRICFMITAVVMLGLLAPQILPLQYVAFIGFGTMTTTYSSIAYVLLAELSPGDGRGQVVAGYQFLGNLIGLGLAPTIIAQITDQVLHDEMQLHLSMALVAVPAAAVGAVLITLAMPSARRLRATLTAQAAPA
jgi:MFS family permease